MSLKNNLKLFKSKLKENFNLDFDKITLKRLREETTKADKNNDEIAAYQLDVASDIKELMSDRFLERQDFNFNLESLLILFFRIS